MKLRYAVVFERTPNNYCAYVPDVPGCISTGKTWGKMLAMIEEALTFHIEMMVKDGDPIPEQKMSLEDAVADYLEPIPEDVMEFFRESGEPETILSVTFQMLEIEVLEQESASLDDDVTEHSMRSLRKAGVTFQDP